MTADLVLIGAGPHGLAVLAALAARPEPWPDRVVVVDPHDRWMHAWDEKLARLDLDRLRSPQVHHPGPRPMAFRDLVEAEAVEMQVGLRRPEAERVPTPAGMRVFVDGLVEGLGPVEWRRGRIVSIATGDGDSSQVQLELEASTGPGDAHRIAAGHVVIAHNPSVPRVPEWAAALIERGAVQHASTVDLREVGDDLRGRHVAVVGGGLTAGSLVAGALDRGARVTLLTRRPLRARPYDVDASWLGPRRLAVYDAASAAERRALIDEARDGGTMPPRVLDALWERERTPGSGLVIREAVDVEAEVLELLAEVDLESGGGDVAPPVTDVWFATGFVNDVAEDPLVAPMVRHLGIPVHGGLPEVDGDLRLPGTNVFVAGPYAALGVGPASRNLAGARPAAARIAAALVRGRA
ncbi:MAG: FAD-dependent oxidoreductase [Solirubrobacteraceae bacterium]|nr:FAD-dependent oxidoreductase [Patulibacter sp.]